MYVLRWIKRIVERTREFGREREVKSEKFFLCKNENVISCTLHETCRISAGWNVPDRLKTFTVPVHRATVTFRTRNSRQHYSRVANCRRGWVQMRITDERKRRKGSLASLSVYIWTASDESKATYTHVHKRHIAGRFETHRFFLFFFPVRWSSSRCKVPFYEKSIFDNAFGAKLIGTGREE